jgi:hypothetical protein
MYIIDNKSGFIPLIFSNVNKARQAWKICFGLLLQIIFSHIRVRNLNQ